MANIRTAASASNSPETNSTLAELESQLVNANQALIDSATRASQEATTSQDIEINIIGGSISGGSEENVDSGD